MNLQPYLPGVDLSRLNAIIPDRISELPESEKARIRALALKVPQPYYERTERGTVHVWIGAPSAADDEFVYLGEFAIVALDPKMGTRNLN